MSWSKTCPSRQNLSVKARCCKVRCIQMWLRQQSLAWGICKCFELQAWWGERQVIWLFSSCEVSIGAIMQTSQDRTYSGQHWFLRSKLDVRDVLIQLKSGPDQSNWYCFAFEALVLYPTLKTFIYCKITFINCKITYPTARSDILPRHECICRKCKASKRKLYFQV